MKNLSKAESSPLPSKVERMTLQECKDRIANDFGIEKWVHITPRYSAEKMMVLMDEAAELYASQFKSSPDSPLNPSGVDLEESQHWQSFCDELQVGVQRILRDQGAASIEVRNAINDTLTSIIPMFDLTRKKGL